MGLWQNDDRDRAVHGIEVVIFVCTYSLSKTTIELVSAG